MRIQPSWNEIWLSAAKRNPGICRKEASKFANSCSWWTDCCAFGWRFICSMCSCRAKHHHLSSRNRSWHFNCCSAPMGDQLLGEKIGSSSGSFQSLRGKVEEREDVPWPRQSPADPEFPKAPGENGLRWRSKLSDFPKRKKSLEAGFSGFMLIRVKSESLDEGCSSKFILTFLWKNTSCEELTLQPSLIWHSPVPLFGLEFCRACLDPKM